MGRSLAPGTDPPTDALGRVQMAAVPLVPRSDARSFARACGLQRNASCRVDSPEPRLQHDQRRTIDERALGFIN